MLIKEGQMHEVLLILRSPEGKFSSADAHTAPGLCQVSSAVSCELKEWVKMQGIFFVWVLEWAEFDESLLSAHWRSQCRAGVIGNFGLKGRKSIMETPLQPAWRGYTLYNHKIANANEDIETHTHSKRAPPLPARFNCAHLLWYWNSYTRPLNMWLRFSRLLKSL